MRNSNKKNKKNVFARLCDFIKRYKKEMIIPFIIIVIILVVYYATLDLFKDSYGNFANYLQIVTTLLALFAYINTIRLLNKREKIKLVPTDADTILMISLNPYATNMAQGLKGELGRYGKLCRLKKIEIEDTDGSGTPKDNVLFEGERMNLKKSNIISGALEISLKEDGKLPLDEEKTAEDCVKDFQNCIQQFASVIAARNGDVHVFIAAPVEFPAFMMPYFINKKTLHFYHRNTGERREQAGGAGTDTKAKKKAGKNQKSDRGFVSTEYVHIGSI